MGLVVNQLLKNFGDLCALDRISFQVEHGETFGVLGRNGAGKTTTIRILLKILEQDGGDVFYNGQDIRTIQTRFGYLPEERGLYLNYSVKDQVLYLARMYGVATKEADLRLRSLLERFGISEYYDKKVKSLSKGNKQKIQLIASMIHNPDVIILDEPFSGLDPVNIQLFKDIILDLKQQQKTIIFSSHRMEDVEEICDTIILLKKGREVLSGTVPQIRQKFDEKVLVVETDSDRNIAALVEACGMKLKNWNQNRGEIFYGTKNNIPGFQKKLVDNGVQIMHFEHKFPTLHEIFLSQLGD